MRGLTEARAFGDYWERAFCKMLVDLGYTVLPHQIKCTESAAAYGPKRLIMADVTVLQVGNVHHEVKHKNPTRFGSFGLEQYRFKSLWRLHELGNPTYYTIHNHDLAGGPHVMENHIDHWVAADVPTLAEGHPMMLRGRSFISGKLEENVPILYWKAGLFSPLKTILNGDAR